jgi:hypothetical protein
LHLSDHIKKRGYIPFYYPTHATASTIAKLLMNRGKLQPVQNDLVQDVELYIDNRKNDLLVLKKANESSIRLCNLFIQYPEIKEVVSEIIDVAENSYIDFNIQDQQHLFIIILCLFN